MIFKSSAGAGGISVSTGCNPVSLRTHPYSSASKSPFHWFTCKNTRLLWNLAAAEVGGNELGSTCVKLVANLSQYFLYRNPRYLISFHCTLPQMQLRQLYQFGPEWHLNCKKLELAEGIYFPWIFWECTFSYIPNKQDVVSHPRNSCKNGMCLHTKVPSFAWTSLMFHTHPFVFFLRSKAKKIFLLCGGMRCNKRTSKSVSSPINTVSMDSADSIAFWTMNWYASAWS